MLLTLLETSVAGLAAPFNLQQSHQHDKSVMQIFCRLALQKCTLTLRKKPLLPLGCDTSKHIF